MGCCLHDYTISCARDIRNASEAFTCANADILVLPLNKGQHLPLPTYQSQCMHSFPWQVCVPGVEELSEILVP